MVVYDGNGSVVKNPDLDLGGIGFFTRLKEEAEPLSDSKPAWSDDDYEEIAVYTPWDADRLAEIEEAKAKGAVPQRTAALEGALADTDEAMCAMYEGTLAQQAVIDAQDEAICALYEATLGGA